MKNIILTSITIFIHFSVFAQIPNADFENWESIQNYEKPLFWNTNQDTSIMRFLKDENSFEGDYSLKIVSGSQNSWDGCLSMATTEVKLNAPVGNNQSLTFYVKSHSDNSLGTTFLQVTGAFFEGNTFVSNYEWTNFEVIENFTLVQIPILNSNVDSLTISINGGAVASPIDGCSNYSISWIDAFEIKETMVTSTESFEQNTIAVFPNPSSGKFIIEGDLVGYESYRIVDIIGREIKSGEIGKPEIQLNKRGLYILCLENSKFPKKNISKKIIIR